MAKLRATRKSYLKEALSQEKRIKGFLRRATKRGYMFPENIMPKRPDVINKEYVEKLRELTPPSMYKEAHWVDPTTGEYVTGYQGRKTERKRASKKAQRTKQKRKQRRYEQYAPPEETEPRPYMPTDDPDFYSETVIRNFHYILSHYSPEATWVLRNWIANLIFKYGANEVALMLQTGAEMGLIVTWDVVYDEQMQRSYMSDMVNYIASIEPEDAEIYGQAFYDALERDDGYVMVQ